MHHRLDWSENHEGPINSAALETIQRWIRANGKVELTGSAVALDQILDGDLKIRIVKKFTYMRDQYRRRMRQGGVVAPSAPGTRAPSVSRRRAEDDQDGGDGEDGFGGGEGPPVDGDEGGDNGEGNEDANRDGDEMGMRVIFRSRAESVSTALEAVICVITNHVPSESGTTQAQGCGYAVGGSEVCCGVYGQRDV